jgi:hypothetical protein
MICSGERVRTEPGRQLNRAAEKIIMMLDRFARGGPDSNLDLAVVLSLLAVPS